jgi:glycosyltransferase involved in cell wall biosynthesis
MAGAAHGGAETAFIDMCLALADAGVAQEVATRRNPRNAPLEARGIRVYTLPFGGPADLYTPWRIKGIARAFRPHIAQTWMSRAAQRTPKLRGLGCLVVSRLGGYYALKHFRSTDYFTAITPDLRGFLIGAGVAPGKVRHINNFAETEQAAAPADRAALDTPADAPLLLALGRLHEAKAFDVLLRALAELPGLYLWIAGEGPQRQELEALCASLGLRERVRFLGWRDDRAALFAAADICVFSSRYEPFGTVFVQAWAAGVPLVTTTADGPRQYVRDAQDGLVVSIDDAPALAAAIRRLAADPALAAQLAANGRRRYEGEFTRERTVADYLAFYREILARENLGED